MCHSHKVLCSHYFYVCQVDTEKINCGSNTGQCGYQRVVLSLRSRAVFHICSKIVMTVHKYSPCPVRPGSLTTPFTKSPQIPRAKGNPFFSELILPIK